MILNKTFWNHNCQYKNRICVKAQDFIKNEWGNEDRKLAFIEHKMNVSCSQMDYFINYPNRSL